ncbi:unnamed protein product [Orchesella dallaii]|uniref:Uncharacterized protein n=1 Tax=Orchesella dallaii TaxID=48710 RepID=A0ABP1RFF9_9HEXA
MRLLAQDGNLEMDDLWKRAEAFHDFIQDERKESAKSLQAPGFAKTIDVKKFRYNPQLQNAQTESYKECANVKKACLSNRKKVKPMKATSLVPPPQAPQLSFLVPKIHRDMNRMCTPKIHSKPAVSPTLPSNKTSFQDTRLPRVTTADKLKSKIIMELMQFSTDKNPPAEKRPKTARKNFSTPRWEPVVNVLELVTSYIPESKSTSFTSNRNRRLSF